MTTTDLIGTAPWRMHLQPAFFRGARFHVEAGSAESGRRIVVHEFPKKNSPYSEDMGRAALRMTVRGYCIAYVRDADDLFQRDYTKPRDRLIFELEKEGAGVLQLPLLPPVSVVCTRYRVTEEDRRGGYCVFDMMFVEEGIDPFTAPPESSESKIDEQADVVTDQVYRSLTPGQPTGEVEIGEPEIQF